MDLVNDSPRYAEAPSSWLARRAIQGDLSARNEIVERTMPQLLAWFAAQIRASRAFGAEPLECVNEVWMRALARFETLDPDAGSIRGWLFGIARNVLNEHRYRAMRYSSTNTQHAHVERALSAVEDSITRVSEVLVRSEQHQILTKLLETLDTEDTLLITWHGLEGRPLADVAGELGITRDAAAKRWLRLLAELRARGHGLGLFEPEV